MAIAGQPYTVDTILLSGIFDKLSFLAWTKTQDAQKGINQPKSIMAMFISVEKETTAFESGEDFMRERQRILEEKQGGE